MTKQQIWLLSQSLTLLKSVVDEPLKGTETEWRIDARQLVRKLTNELEADEQKRAAKK